MTNQWKLLLFMAASLAVAEGGRLVRAQKAGDDPSQTISPINPSQTIPPVNPSQTIPPVNPSQTVTPGVPSQAMPPSSRGLTDRQLADQVRASILRGPLASNGLPAVGATGIGVTDLQVVAENGKVTLRGTVHSIREWAEAASRAAALAGEQNVINELKIR